MGDSAGRRQFVMQGCACAAALVGLPRVSAGSALADTPPATPTPANPGLVQPVNGEQVMAVLSDIDRSGDAALIDAVFTRWGYQCFHNRPQLKAFAEKQRLDFRGYLDYVNSGRARAWERLDFDEARGILKVTSRKSGRCACPYAQCAQPAKALCTHCCKMFQTELFRCMTGRDVSVQIDEATLLGGERCCTTVRLLPK